MTIETIEIKKPKIKLPINSASIVKLNKYWFPDSTSMPNQRYFMTVVNSPDGRKFIEEFRLMNNNEYHIKLRGRHSNRKQAFKEVGRRYYSKTQNDVPISLAERYVVYVDSKVRQKALYNYNTNYRTNMINGILSPDFKLVP